jgi:hypothetical protein
MDVGDLRMIENQMIDHHNSNHCIRHILEKSMTSSEILCHLTSTIAGRLFVEKCISGGNVENVPCVHLSGLINCDYSRALSTLKTYPNGRLHRKFFEGPRKSFLPLTRGCTAAYGLSSFAGSVAMGP